MGNLTIFAGVDRRRLRMYERFHAAQAASRFSSRRRPSATASPLSACSSSPGPRSHQRPTPKGPAPGPARCALPRASPPAARVRRAAGICPAEEGPSGPPAARLVAAVSLPPSRLPPIAAAAPRRPPGPRTPPECCRVRSLPPAPAGASRSRTQGGWQRCHRKAQRAGAPPPAVAASRAAGARRGCRAMAAASEKTAPTQQRTAGGDGPRLPAAAGGREQQRAQGSPPCLRPRTAGARRHLLLSELPSLPRPGGEGGVGGGTAAPCGGADGACCGARRETGGGTAGASHGPRPCIPAERLRAAAVQQQAAAARGSATLKSRRGSARAAGERCWKGRADASSP